MIERINAVLLIYHYPVMDSSQMGQRMRVFGEKWHASDVAAKRADEVYTTYINA